MLGKKGPRGSSRFTKITDLAKLATLRNTSTRKVTNELPSIESNDEQNIGHESSVSNSSKEKNHSKNRLNEDINQNDHERQRGKPSEEGGASLEVSKTRAKVVI